MKHLVLAMLITLLGISCSSQKEVVEDSQTTDRGDRQRGDRQGPPNIDEVFKMDTNNDGMLSKSELTGRLAERFDTIDTNGDGFITRTEFENAPRPQRGQRRTRQQ